MKTNFYLVDMGSSNAVPKSYACIEKMLKLLSNAISATLARFKTSVHGWLIGSKRRKGETGVPPFQYLNYYYL